MQWLSQAVWLLALALPVQPQQELLKPVVIETVSTGAPFVLENVLMRDHPTVVVWYQETSSADRALVEQLKQRAQSSDRVGLRLIRLRSLGSPAAQAYDIRETPTLMALDRFGHLLVRSSKVEDLMPAVNQAMGMARIAWVDERDPVAEKVYRMMGGGKQPVPEIIKTMSLRPDLMEGMARIAQTGHFTDGYLSHKTKEMIATYVSAINHCKY